MVVCQGQPGLLLAHDRVSVAEVGTLERAAAVRLAAFPPGVAEGTLIEATGRWDGASLSPDQVSAVASPPHEPQRAEEATLTEGHPFSADGQKALHTLDRAGILSGRRLRTTGSETIVVIRVTDTEQAHQILDATAAPERFEVLPSTWTNDQLRGARSIASLVPERELFAAGEYYDDDAEAHVTLTVKLVRPSLDEAIRRVPNGLLRVTAYLRPA